MGKAELNATIIRKDDHSPQHITSTSAASVNNSITTTASTNNNISNHQQHTPALSSTNA